MTIFKGVLLFDIAEPTIGDWENQLGYRGMMEVWKHKKTGDTITIEPYEDCTEHDPDECQCHEIWIADDKNGQYDSIGIYNTFEEADQETKKWMREHLEGWT